MDGIGEPTERGKIINSLFVGKITKVKVWNDGVVTYDMPLCLPGQSPIELQRSVQDGEVTNCESMESVRVYGDELTIPWNEHTGNHNKN